MKFGWFGLIANLILVISLVIMNIVIFSRLVNCWSTNCSCAGLGFIDTRACMIFSIGTIFVLILDWIVVKINLFPGD
jgi:hypothetical protein